MLFKCFESKQELHFARHSSERLHLGIIVLKGFPHRWRLHLLDTVMVFHDLVEVVLQAGAVRPRRHLAAPVQHLLHDHLLSWNVIGEHQWFNILIFLMETIVIVHSWHQVWKWRTLQSWGLAVVLLQWFHALDGSIWRAHILGHKCVGSTQIARPFTINIKPLGIVRGSMGAVSPGAGSMVN